MTWRVYGMATRNVNVSLFESSNPSPSKGAEKPKGVIVAELMITRQRLLRPNGRGLQSLETKGAYGTRHIHIHSEARWGGD